LSRRNRTDDVLFQFLFHDLFHLRKSLEFSPNLAFLCQTTRRACNAQPVLQALYSTVPMLESLFYSNCGVQLLGVTASTEMRIHYTAVCTINSTTGYILQFLALNCIAFEFN
ncbi:unnamed protein product, partial [Ascophyllum nodosum]